MFGSVAKWSRFTGSLDDDWIDRLNHIWTVVLFIMFALVVSSSQYVGDPIHCWCPTEFSGAYVAYTKSYCWISNTYYVPMSEGIPTDFRTKLDKEITYYQWVPVILLFQALLFKIPNIVWHVWNGYSGVSLDKVAVLAGDTMLASPDERKNKISHISIYINRWIESQREYRYNLLVRIREKISNIFCFCIGKRYGTFLTGFYLFVKLLYCVNVIGQFFLLNAFMSDTYSVFGFEVIDHLYNGGEWVESPRFPRVTLCDFQIRQLNNIHQWTVQCVLPINLFNEKIFIFIWFWMALVAALTCINFLSWLYHIVIRENRSRFVRKYLKIVGELNTAFDKKLSRKFADEYLRDDGIFVLRVVGKNSSHMVLTDLIQSLWKLFKEVHCSHRNASLTEPPEITTELMNGIPKKEDMYTCS